MLWGVETFIIAAWLTITPLAQFSDTTSVILVEFSETMSVEELLNPDNYKVGTIDSLATGQADSHFFEIYKIGIVSELDSIIISDTSLVALVTERIPHKTTFFVRAKNLKDRAGNFLDSTRTVFHFFNGFAPNKFTTPTVSLDK
jgi:hypothetical protein